MIFMWKEAIQKWFWIDIHQCWQT